MSSALRLSRFALLLLAMLVFSARWGHALAFERNCSEVCDSSADCDEECFVGLDTDSTCGAYGTCYASECGNVCGSDVSCDTQCYDGGDTTCGGDDAACYGGCGDGVCQTPFESCGSCETDCGSCPSSCGEGDPTCEVDSDCPNGNEWCDNGCCVIACSGDCGGQSRSCNDYQELCDSGGQCCPDERCAQLIPGGPKMCFQYPH